MRISGWMIGVGGLVALAVLTVICSVVTFTFTRQAVVDFQGSGILLDSPGKMIGCFAFENCEVTASPTPDIDGSSAVVVIASPTALVVSSPTPEEPVNTGPTPTLQLTASVPTPDPAQFGQPAVSPTPVPTVIPDVDIPTWDDPRQIRILLMGIDQRSATGERGPFRTDTMMVLNVDPVRKTVGVISLPRDLWVSIPNFVPGRINEANFVGDLNAYPGGGGPALAMETIAENFGIRIDKFITVNFDVFTAVVDTLAPNGVEICVSEYIDDPDYPDARYGYIHVTFEVGCQRLDAERLLQYARNRATQGGDFDRARRQQETLDALRAEVLSAGGIANFILQAPVMWEQLSGSYQTNLTYEEILSLGKLMSDINDDNIHFAVIDNLYVDLATTAAGDQVLIPQQSRISELIQRVFYPQNTLDQADLRTRSEVEGAQIFVYNGTDIAGLAGSTREWLTGRGILVSGVGNDADHNGQNTVVRDYGGYPWTAKYIADILGLPPERIEPGADGLIAEGVMIVSGPDIQPLLTGQ